MEGVDSSPADETRGRLFQNLLVPEGPRPPSARRERPELASGINGVMLQVRPGMFRGNPLLFLLAIVLVPVFGVGALLLGAWWLRNVNIMLTITPQRTLLRRGVFNKDVSEIVNTDIRDVHIHQSLIDRLCRVGHIGISTAGQAGIEISVGDIPDPYGIKTLLDGLRFGRPMGENE